MEMQDLMPDYGLENAGLHDLEQVHWNLSTPMLHQWAVRRYEGAISHLGPLVVSMGQHTGRAAKDKYVVEVLASGPGVG